MPTHKVNPAKRKFTPAEVASMFGVDPDKIIAFIRAGELKAMNCASPGRNLRPRYLIDADDLADFELSRMVRTAPHRVRQQRRPRDTGATQYY